MFNQTKIIMRSWESTMFFGRACTVVARDTSELTPEPDTCVEAWMITRIVDKVQFWGFALITYSSRRCNCSDSGSGWRGTHPSRTAIRPTFVSTWQIQLWVVDQVCKSSQIGKWILLEKQGCEVLIAAHTLHFSGPVHEYLIDTLCSKEQII